jgi:hypothetical protein
MPLECSVKPFLPKVKAPKRRYEKITDEAKMVASPSLVFAYRHDMTLLSHTDRCSQFLSWRLSIVTSQDTISSIGGLDGAGETEKLSCSALWPISWTVDHSTEAFLTIYT